MYNDDAVFELFREGNLNGVFQFASQGIQVIARKVQPRKLDDIALAIAMYRPGPLSSGIAFDIDSLRATPHLYGNNVVDEILKESGGIIVYQEQLMHVWQYVADGTLGEADILRKLVGKKITGSPKWKKYHSMFFIGGKKKGMTSNALEELWTQIEGAGMYSFNKCISGDMIFDRSWGGRRELTIRDMYNERLAGKSHVGKKYKYKGFGKALSMFDDGKVRKNNIVDIYYSGIRSVYRITTESGWFIDVTSNHNFPTPNGKMSIDDGLSVGSEIYVRSEYKKSKFDYSFTGEQRVMKGKSYNKSGFPNGKENPGYINGSFIEFKKNKKIKFRDIGKCEICGKKHRRLEMHHKNGNRSDNSMSNLVLLCPSCHKKEHYKIGRTKQGERGYGVITEGIVSIEYVGEKDTYDIEMADPAHNFCVNHIVTSNSHAISYAMLSYDTAFYKVYHPEAFYASMMQFDSKKALGYIIEAIDRGFAVNPVDINASTSRYVVSGNNILMPLSAVKGVGDVATNAIVNERNLNGKYKSCKDFRERLPKRQVNKRVVKSIFALGGFNEFSDFEQLKLSHSEIVDIRSEKRRKLTKQYLGFSLPTKKLIDSIRRNSTGDSMVYGIVTHIHEGVSSAGRKYFKVVCWSGEDKTFFFKKTYEVVEGDVVKIFYKPHTQSGTAMEVIG